MVIVLKDISPQTWSIHQNLFKMNLEVLKHYIPHPFHIININIDNHIRPSPIEHHPMKKFSISITQLQLVDSRFFAIEC